MHKVTETFIDRDGKEYVKGDEYKGSKKRIAELLGDNKYGRAFIKKQEEKPKKKEGK